MQYNLEKKENIKQYECYVNNETYMDKERIKYALKEIKYRLLYSFYCGLFK